MQDQTTGEKKRFRVGPVRMAIGAVILLFALGFWGALMFGQVGAFEVESGSMEPTLLIGDRILAKASPALLNVGDIISLKSPDDNGPDLVKRIVAKPGDMIEFRDQRFYVNGVPSPPPGAATDFHPHSQDRTLVLKPEQYYVLGDNRPRSDDSEEFGPIDRGKVHRIVFLRYWPLARFGRIK